MPRASLLTLIAKDSGCALPAAFQFIEGPPFESKPAYVTLLGNVCKILLWSLASWSVNRTLKVSMGSFGSTRKVKVVSLGLPDLV